MTGPLRAWIVRIALPLVAAVLACACGSGGTPSASSGGPGNSTSGSTASCGGTSTNTTTGNVVPLVVDGVCSGLNQAYVTIKMCLPGSTTACRTVDHIWVDTGSTGLRVMASALSLGFPPSSPQNGNVVANCGQFISGYVWGSMRLADISIGGESASSVPIQIVGDTQLPAAPSTCASAGSDVGSVAKMGANGILGLGFTQQDCGPGCASGGSSAPQGWYYTCPNSACTPTYVPTSQQLQNLIGAFGVNGVQFQLPPVGASGLATSTGTLTFGITSLGSATVFALDANPNDQTYLDLATTFNATAFPQSYVDSGSNGWFFDDAAITPCGNGQPVGFFCQSVPGLTATMQGFASSISFAYAFSVADASTLSGSNAAFSNLAGPASSNGQVGVTFDWGLPFFFGRSVYVVPENQSVTVAGPFVAATTP